MTHETAVATYGPRTARIPSLNATSLAVVLALWLLLAPATAHAEQRWQNPVKAPAYLFDVDMVDATHGWAVGVGGSIYKTTDGVHWNRRQESGVTAAVTAVDFVNTAVGWAVCGDGTILKTTNGGVDWSPQDWAWSENSRSLRDIGFYNSQYGWAVGERYVPPLYPWDSGYATPVVLWTFDGGENWNSRPLFPGTPLAANGMGGTVVVPIDPNSAYVQNHYDGVWGSWLKTEDAGDSWTGATFPTVDGLTGYVSDIYFSDPSHGWAVGRLFSQNISANCGMVIYATDDGGDNWHVQLSRRENNYWEFAWGRLTEVHFTDNLHGWAYGAGGGWGQVYSTVDGGVNWTRTLLPNVRYTDLDVTESIAMSFPDNDHGVVLSGNAMMNYGLPPGVLDNAHLIAAANGATGVEEEGVSIHAASETTETNAWGRAYLSSRGVNRVSASKSGFRKSETIANLEPGGANLMLLDTWKTDGKPYVTMAVNKRSATAFADVLHETESFDEDSLERCNLICSADWNGHPPGEYVLYQEDVALRSREGTFTFLPGGIFDPDKDIYLRLISDDGTKSEHTKVRIDIQKASVQRDFPGGTRLGPKSGFTVPKDVPIVGDAEFDVGMGFIPIAIERDGDKFKAGIGIVDARKMSREWKKFTEALDSNKNSPEKVEKILKKYGGKRSKFSVMKESAGSFDPIVGGYGEGVVDPDGTFRFTKGYIVVGGDAEHRTTWQYLVGPVPCYIELMVGVEFQVESGLDKLVTKDASFVTYANITVSPKAALGGGLGINGAASIGAEGKVVIPIYWNMRNDYVTVDVTGSMSIKVSVLFIFTGEKKMLEGTWHVYDSRWKASQASASTADPPDASLFKVDALRMAPRTASSKSSFLRALSVSALDGDPLTPVVVNAMPSTQPQMVRVGDKLLAVYQADEPTRSSINRTTLMYSVNSGGTWSPSQPVWDNGAPDGAATLVSDGARARLVWQKASSAVTASAEATTGELLSALAAKQEIAVASWDPTGSTFADKSYVTSNSALDILPRAELTGDDLLISWTSNSLNDVFGTSGVNTIYTAAQSESWTARPVAATPNPVLDTAVTNRAGVPIVAYLLDTDHDLRTQTDVELYIGSAAKRTRLTANTVAESRPQFRDGRLFWSDGELKAYDPSSQVILPVFESGQSVGHSYAFVSDGARDGVSWLVPGPDGGTVVRARWLGDSTTRDFDLARTAQAIGTVSPVTDADGTWHLLTAGTLNGSASIDYAAIAPHADPALTDVTIDEGARTAAGVPTTLRLTNSGTTVSENLSLRVAYVPSKLKICEVPLGVQVPRGGSVDCSLTLPLPEVSQATTLSFEVLADNDPDTTDNTAAQAIGYPNLAVDVQQVDLADRTVVMSRVTNRGLTANGGTLIIREAGETSETIASYELETLPGGAGREFSTTLARAAGTTPSPDATSAPSSDPYVVEVLPTSAEIVTGDNSALFTVPWLSAETTPADEPTGAPVPITGVRITNGSLVSTLSASDIGTVIPLSYASTPASATTQAVTWSSSNDAVIAVDADGLATVAGSGVATITVTSAEGAHSDSVRAWVRLAEPHQVSFFLGTNLIGTGSVGDGETLIPGDLPVVARPGYTFLGWALPGSGLPINPATFLVLADTELEALWRLDAPSAPQNVMAPSVTTTSHVTVTWLADEYATSFEYRVNLGTPVSVETTSADVTGLVAGENTIEVRALNAGGASGWATASPKTAFVAPTAISLTAPACARKGTATLTGRLVSTDGAPLADSPVAIDYKQTAATSWLRSGTTTTQADGTWTFVYNPTTDYERNHAVRAVFEGQENTYASAESTGALPVLVDLTQPTLSVSSPRNGRSFKVTGYVKPRFKSRSLPVKIGWYKKQSNGTYKYVRSTSLRASDASSRSKLTCSTSLRGRGRWRARLYFSGSATSATGARFAKSYGAYRYFTVK